MSNAVHTAGSAEADLDPRTVSVIIPTHDRVDLIGRALASVYAQTVMPGEVIVVDDGSTDGTASYVRATYPNVRLVQQENRGVSAARNHGLRVARGHWFAFLDSDDEWQPIKLERQLEVLRSRPGERVCHTDEIWIRRGRRVNPMRKHQKRGGEIYEHCLPLCAMSPSSVLVHKHVLDDVGAFDEALPACEDYDLWLRICARYPVVFVSEPLVVRYGGHEDQLSQRYPAMDRFRIVALERMLEPGRLSASQRAATLAMLEHKVSVYANGARRRGHVEQARAYEAKLARWRADVPAHTEHGCT